MGCRSARQQPERSCRGWITWPGVMSLAKWYVGPAHDARPLRLFYGLLRPSWGDPDDSVNSAATPTPPWLDAAAWGRTTERDNPAIHCPACPRGTELDHCRRHVARDRCRVLRHSRHPVSVGGGFRAPDAESSQVADMMSKTFGQGEVQMVPAFTHLLGRRNWWAPARMARWHERFGIRDVAPARRVSRTGGRHRAVNPRSSRAGVGS